MERKTLKKKKPVKRAESHSDTRGSHQGLPSAAQKAKYPEVWWERLTKRQSRRHLS